MARGNRIDIDNGHYDSLIVTTTFIGPDGFVTNAKVQASAGIVASKLESWQKAVYGQSGTCVSATVLLGIIRGATGRTIGVEVTNQVACAGASTVTVDVKKNGVSILSAVVTLNSSSSTSVPIAGTVSTTTLADGDIITAVITTNASGTDALATGVGVQWDYNEDHPEK